MIHRIAQRLNPITRKRLRRFRGMKRAWWSFVILVVAYALSLGAELICGDTPLYVRYQGQSYFPVFRFYPEDTFTGSGRLTRPNYKKIAESSDFQENPGSIMVFPLIPYGPYETLEPSEIDVPDEVSVRIAPEAHVATVDVNADLTIERSRRAGWFFGADDDGVDGKAMPARIPLDDALREAIAKRLRNEADERVERTVTDSEGRRIEVSVASFEKRRRTPKTVRMRLTEAADEGAAEKLAFGPDGEVLRGESAIWERATAEEKERVLGLVKTRFELPVERRVMTLAGERVAVSFDKTDVRFPFPPVWPQHPLGIDDAGRDVLARIVYGFRISMSFAVLLVVTSMGVGTVIGAVQGYFGGLLDITAQRLIEVWSALPFLYIMILTGSIFGRSFVLLLVVYGIFNWIGISYYMRAEFLRLRRQQFVESARALGVSTGRILFSHILPNALVPLVTFFPFQLVGAIGSLAALDYLGFGMPPPTASWGELLNQAGMYRWAWWLILYPSLALFLVILMGVFVGEGLRAAFDPRDYD